MMKRTILIFALHCAVTVAEVQLNCGGSAALTAVHCPNQPQNFTCEVSSVSMQWESSAFTSDIEFFGSPLGKVRKNNLFTAEVTLRTPDKMVSVITFPSDSSLDGVIVKCLDFYDGQYKTCTIHISYPCSPSLPVGLGSQQMSTDVVMLYWISEECMGSSDHDLLYNVTYWSHVSQNHSSVLATNLSELVLQSLLSGVEYYWKLEVENCMGWNKSITEMFEIVTKAPSAVEDLKVCIQYNLVDTSWQANVNWKKSLVDSTFQSKVLQYDLYMISNDELGNITIITTDSNTTSIQVQILPYTLYNFTVLAKSEIGESINNPSVIISVNRSFSENVLFIGDTFAVMLILIDFSGCVLPSVFEIAFHYKIQNAQQHNQAQTLHLQYHSTVDKEGKFVVLQSLKSNSTYVYTISTYESGSLIVEPRSGNFTTREDTNDTSARAIDQSLLNISSNSYTADSLVMSEQTMSSVSNTTTQNEADQLRQNMLTSAQPAAVYYTWILTLLGALMIFVIILLFLLCFVFYVLLRMRKNMKICSAASYNRTRPVVTATNNLYLRKKNILVMSDNDAYASIKEEEDCSSPSVEYEGEPFRKRYCT